jgi:4-amino-4-deoxy-L-arabinose transferase-like glycosyltransferase
MQKHIGRSYYFMRISRSETLQITIILLLAAVWKIIFLIWDVFPFNSDEAVVALMGRHIIAGARPVFFYGQAYMGSLDAILVAGGFWIFGQQVWVIRLVQVLLYLGTVLTTVYIGKEAFGSIKVGLFAALMLAVPTVNVMLYTTVSLGGYGEAMFLGNLLLLISLIIVRMRILPDSGRFPSLLLLLWGILAGIGFWANGLSLVFSLPAGLYLLWGFSKTFRDPGRKSWLLRFFLIVGLGFLLGCAPWVYYALSNGIDRLVMELFGTAIAVEQAPWIVRTLNHLLSFLLLGLTVIFGFRPPWGIQWLGLPLMPFILLFWGGVLVFFFRKLRKSGGEFRSSYFLMAGVVGILLAGFLFTHFGADPSGRYFLPLALPLSLLAAQMILAVARRPLHTALLVGLVVGYHAVGTLQSALNFPPGLTTQFHEPTIIDHRADGELIDFLLQQGETRGYSNYWVTYPLAFQSREELIFVPRLPYHLDLRYTPRDDRYGPYQELVAQSPRVAYITTRNPDLDTHIRASFDQLGVTWNEKQIGDYLVYYQLSRAVRPEEIGLGELRE